MPVASGSRPSETMADINVTPFTDVLLVLLIIFMLLGTLAVPPGFQKQFPHTQHPGDGVEPSRIIRVRVTADNRIYIDNRAVRYRDLYQAMAAAVEFHREHAAQGYSSRVELFGASNTRYDTIIKILDAARQAGEEDVGFVTQ